MKKPITGRDIAAERTRLSMNQTQLGEAAGMPRQRVCGIESGRINARPEEIERLMAAIARVAKERNG